MRFYRTAHPVVRDENGAWYCDAEPPHRDAQRMWVQWPDFMRSPPGMAYITWVAQ